MAFCRFACFHVARSSQSVTTHHFYQKEFIIESHTVFYENALDIAHEVKVTASALVTNVSNNDDGKTIIF